MAIFEDRCRKRFNSIFTHIYLIEWAEIMIDNQNSKAHISNFYAAIGDQLIHFNANIDTAKLKQNAFVRFGLNIQYVWSHPNLSIIYLALSNGGPGNKGTKHQLCACNLNTKDGTIDCLLYTSPSPRD